MSILVAGLCLAGAALAEPLEDTDLDLLLAKLPTVTAPGAWVGPVAALGSRSFVVMTGRSGQQRLPIIAATRFGAGRALIAGHEGLYHPGNAQLAVNTVTWLAGAKGRDARVLLVDYTNLAGLLAAAGFKVTTAGAAQLPGALTGADVLLCNGDNFTAGGQAERLRAVTAWVSAGGGYFGATPGWGWQQLHPNLSLASDFGGNKLVQPMGLAWCDEGLDATTQGGWAPERDSLALSHAGAALEALGRHADGTAKLNKAQLGQVTAVLTNASGALAPSEREFLPKLSALVAKQGAAAVPLPTRPLGLDNPLGRLACVLDNQRLRKTSVAGLSAHPAAAGFPGAVPADAPRVDLNVTIDPRVPEWHSTGLYAAPGEALTVTLPAEAISAGLGLRIGCHTDGIWHHDKWARFPEISYARSLTARLTRFGNPFGGIVYITVPEHCKLTAPLQVRLAGAVRMPLFVLGQTDPAQWRTTIRDYAAPWAELATDKIILSVPASVVRQLDDPTGVLKVWDSGLDAIADLYGISRKRPRPERMVSDQDISAGYMHSGYPIMTFLDVPPVMVDREKMQHGGAKYCWGFWHELGHNHQDDAWTWEGCGEVTNNLYSLYCCETVCGEKVAQSSWLNPAQRNAGVTKYFDGGARFSQWQSDPALALMMYAQLQQAFGWDAFKRTFATYHTTAAGPLPRNDGEKRDQFMVRFSRVVGRNLAPFFTAWGLPTSESARQSLNALPAWCPVDVRRGIPFTLP